MLSKLKLNKEFRRVYGRGKSFVAPRLVSYILPKKGGEIRFGITVSKKIGGAVERNKAKRLITAAMRECLPHIKKSCDMVFVARSATVHTKSYDIAAVMKQHLIEAGVWEE